MQVVTATRASAAAATASAAAQSRLTLATRLSTAAMNGLKSASAFFGGPIGLAITALTLGVGYLATRTDEAEAAMSSFNSAVSQAQSSIAQLANAEREVQETKDALKQASEDYKDAVGEEAKAAQDTAAIEIQALNERLDKRRELRQVALDDLRIASNEAKRELQNLEDGVLAGVSRRLRSQDTGRRGTRFDPVNSVTSDDIEAAFQRELEAARAATATGDASDSQIQQIRVAQARSRLEALRESISIAEKGAEGASDSSSGSGASNDTKEILEDQSDAAMRLREELRLLTDEYNRYAEIAKRMGVPTAGPGLLGDMTAQERALYVAEAATGIERARSGAPDGLEDEAEEIEALNQTLGLLKDRIGDTTKAQKSLAEERRKSALDVAKAFEDEAIAQSKAFERQVEEAQQAKETRDNAQAAFDAERASIALSIEDQRRLQAARAEGQEAFERVTRAIVARDEAARIAEAARQKGIAVNHRALEAEILAREEEEATTRRVIKSLQDEEALRERLKGLADAREASLAKAGAASGLLGEIAGVESIGALDNLVERIGDIQRATERRLNLEGQLAALADDATDAERDALRLRIEAGHFAGVKRESW